MSRKPKPRRQHACVTVVRVARRGHARQAPDCCCLATQSVPRGDIDAGAFAKRQHRTMSTCSCAAKGGGCPSTTRSCAEPRAASSSAVCHLGSPLVRELAVESIRCGRPALTARPRQMLLARASAPPSATSRTTTSPMPTATTCRPAQLLRRSRRPVGRPVNVASDNERAALT